jgi:DNA (cytosine-5)-methyltransferase 1
VILVASRTEDPRGVLLADDAEEAIPSEQRRLACGFYWTEGTRGLGWAVDAIPTLKGGSSLGIPSPPAIWMPDGSVVCPDIRDGERLQGFPVGWTGPAGRGTRRHIGYRWWLLGNAVSVPVARWLGQRLASPGTYDAAFDEQLRSRDPWPTAAWNVDGKVYSSHVSTWPVRTHYRHLAEFLTFPAAPLSARATAGFLARARASNLRFADGFLDALAKHLKRMGRS